MYTITVMYSLSAKLLLIKKPIGSECLGCLMYQLCVFDGATESSVY